MIEHSWLLHDTAGFLACPVPQESEEERERERERDILLVSEGSRGTAFKFQNPFSRPPSFGQRSPLRWVRGETSPESRPLLGGHSREPWSAVTTGRTAPENIPGTKSRGFHGAMSG